MSNEALPERVALLKELTTLFSEFGCSEFEFEGAGFSLKLKREMDGGVVNRPSVASSTPAVTQAPPSELVAEESKSASHGHIKTVTSGITGLFFRASAPGKEPFVNVGDTVEAGQTLCLVEAMKMLNAVDSEYSGTVVEILLQDGAEVSVGTPLFAIEVSNV